MRTRIVYRSGITETNQRICEWYWLRESDKRGQYIYTCRQIGLEFGIKHSEISEIAKKNAELIVLDCQCLECGEPRICYTRSDLNQLKPDAWRCDKCREELQNKQIRAFHAQQLEQKRLLKNYREQQQSAIPPLEELNLVEKLLLMSVVECLCSDDLKTVFSLTENPKRQPLSPLHTMDITILMHLFRANILLINPIGVTYENITESGEIDAINYSLSRFDLAYDTQDIARLRVEVREQKNIIALTNNVVFRDWCEKIQLAECVNYLTERSEVNGLKAPLGEKMVSLLSANLTVYSVAALSRLIWIAVEAASAYSNKRGVSYHRASNSIYSNLRSNIDKISCGLWESKTFNRDTKLPQSAIAAIFFDNVFGGTDLDFKNTVDELFNNQRLLDRSAT